MHRHPAYWANPTEFNPTPLRRQIRADNRPKFAYFPFGGGSRQCIGDQFASIEGVLVLAVFLQHFEPQLLTPNYVAEIHPMITLRPARRYAAGLKTCLTRVRVSTSAAYLQQPHHRVDCQQDCTCNYHVHGNEGLCRPAVAVKRNDKTGQRQQNCQNDCCCNNL
jgi:hypothetical protein